jgi:hypothetical protein
MEFSIKQIQDIVLGLGFKKRVTDLVLNIYCTLAGLKASFLWDLGRPPTDPQLRGLQAGLGLLVLRLEGDTLLSTRSSLAGLLGGLDTRPPVFVDISDGRQPAAREPTGGEMSDTRALLQKVLASTEDTVTVEPAAGQNIPCLVGLLLGFPVVYTFCGEASTALDGRELVVVRLGVASGSRSSVPVSYSGPGDLWEEAAVRGGRGTWWAGLGGGVWGRGFTSGELQINVTTERLTLPVVVL